MKAKSEDMPVYLVTPSEDDATIAKALEILERRMRVPGIRISDPATIKKYLILQLGEREHEVFSVVWLDSQNRVIEYDEMFRGTLTQTSVYPREVIKRALELNAGCAIFCHNHPSGATEPSEADKVLTTELALGLKYISVRTLDHIIVAGVSTYSFAEHGLI